MCDCQPENRRWYQIHLSTAILLMIVASLLLGANMKVSIDMVGVGGDGGMQWRSVECYGWPFNIVVEEHYSKARVYSITGLVLNLLVALTVLIFIGIFGEIVVPMLAHWAMSKLKPLQ